MIGESPYGYPYNPPGFEIPYVNDVFRGAREIDISDQQWLSRQLGQVFDAEQGMLSRNNPDGETLTARIYESARFSDRLFNLPIDLSGQ